MYTAAKRRVREAEKRLERLQYKFIAEYIKCLHNDTYKEAEKLYNNIKHQYPTVKDLTKTAEFMFVATPGKRVPRYYTSRKTNPTQPTQTMEMVLEIPPMPSGPNTSLAAAVSPPVSPPVLPPALPSVSPPVSPPVLPPLVSPPVLPPALPSVSPTVSPPVDASHPLLLPEDVYLDLLAELQQDPELSQILNGFTYGDSFHGDTTNDDDIWESIIPDDPTPLEDELEKGIREHFF